MSQVIAKLHRLRGVFVVYFVAKLAIEIFLTRDVLSGPGWGLERLGLPPGTLLAVTLLTAAALFALGWWVFLHLLLKKNWARTLLLVVAWLAVIDATLTFLLIPRMAGMEHWLGRIAPGVEWNRLLLVDRVTDFLGLIYWGYAIYVLQIDPEVKRDFFPPAASDAEK